MDKPHRIVIIGAGFAGTYTLKRLHTLFHGRSDILISLINPRNYFLFTPLLHEVATGGVNPENIIEPLRDAAGCCLDTFHLGIVEKIHTKNKTVQLSHGLVPYDHLVIASGAQTNFFNIKGAQEHSFTLKSLEDAISIKRHLVRTVEKAAHETNEEIQKSLLTFTVVGGGPTGVEMAAEMAEFFHDTFVWYYPKELIEKIKIILVQAGPELLPQFSKAVRVKAIQVLRKKKIDVRTNTTVQKVEQNLVYINGKEKINTHTIIWVAGVKPVTMEFDIKPKGDAMGRIVVNEFLSMPNNQNIFVIGDNAHTPTKDGKGLPALAQVAVKQARRVGDNIAAQILQKPQKKFFYKSTGSMVSLGQWMAAGEIATFTFWGHFTWWIWRTVYLSKLLSFRKKISVAVDWTIDLFYPRDISEI